MKERRIQKEWALTIKVSDNCPMYESKARFGCSEYLGKGKGIVGSFTSRVAANAALKTLAFRHAAESNENGFTPSLYNWSTFCRTANGRAWTQKWDGCYVYTDGDCTTWSVEKMSQIK